VGRASTGRGDLSLPPPCVCALGGVGLVVDVAGRKTKNSGLRARRPMHL